MSVDKQTALRPRRFRAEAGFAMMEVLISMFVLTVGLVSLLGVFAVAMAATQSSQQDMLAKQLAEQTMEGIYAARDTANVTWAQIQNVGAPPAPGIFVTGFTPIYQPGTDGVIGTVDDTLAPLQTLQLPGPDGIVGTTDDPPPMPLQNFQRSIAIAPSPNGATDLRVVTISVRYWTTQFRFPKTYILTQMISQYR